MKGFNEKKSPPITNQIKPRVEDETPTSKGSRIKKKNPHLQKRGTLFHLLDLVIEDFILTPMNILCFHNDGCLKLFDYAMP